MHYYQHNIGDYRKDTGHLTLLEHGIYRQLLDTYYTEESPLTNDLNKLMRSHSVRNADEVQAFENVLNDFFKLTEKGYVHDRCDKELEKIYGKSESARASANARWAKRNKVIDANAMQTQSESNAIGMLPNNPIPNNPITHIPTYTEEFELFWKSYPRHESKSSAMKAFKKVKVDINILLKAIAQQKNSKQWKDNIIPHASTWLNQSRWEDEIITKPTNDIFSPVRTA
jgi:uncharacterized protein YdaU (DUF1376 family)